MALILLSYVYFSAVYHRPETDHERNKALMSHAFGGAMGRWLAWVYGAASGLDHGNTVEQQYLSGASG